MKYLVRLGLAVLFCSVALRSVGEDADRFRPYLRFHSGDIAPLWEVDDHWSFGLGANFNRYLGAEVSLDFFEREYDYKSYGTLGEVSAWNIVPELRLRYPMMKGRLVPYLLAGIGPSFLQINDRKSEAHADVEGYTFAVGVGGGIEYFIADNVTFGIEGKYIYINPIEGKVDGETFDVDVSSPTFTFGLRIYFDENHPRQLVTLDESQPNRFYFGVRVGAGVLTDGDLYSSVDFEPEAAAWGPVSQFGSLLLGADFGSRLGVELSADSLELNLDSPEGKLGEYGMGIVVPQLRLKFPTRNPRLVPYLLAGVGVTYGEFNDSSNDEIDVDAKGIYPALRVGGGLEYFLVRNFSFNADAAWTYSWGHEFDVDGVGNGKGDFSIATLSLGFRVYLFEF